MLVFPLFDFVFVLGSSRLVGSLGVGVLCSLGHRDLVELLEGVDMHSLFVAAALSSAVGTDILVYVFDIVVLLTLIVVLGKPVESVASCELGFGSKRVREGVCHEICSLVDSVGSTR